MSLSAFYIEPREWGPLMELNGKEAEHAKVLRIKAGMEVLALDGQGKSALCVFESFGRKSARLKILEEKYKPAPNAKAIIALALSKAVRRGFFMEKASELGAWEVWLWQAERSQGKLFPALGESCRAQMIAGIKQCHNPWLPRIRLLEHAGDVIASASGVDWRFLPWEEPGGSPMLTAEQAGKPGVSLYVIGPEGGFSSAELSALAAAQFTNVSLGNLILRCETAAALCLGLHWWASQLPGGPDFIKPGGQNL